jgi:hypothetical protein
MKTTKLSAKAKLAQKVLVRTINEFLRRGVFTLDPADAPQDHPVIEFDMAGIPAIAAVSDVGHGELSIKVTLWPNAHGREFIKAAALASAHRSGRGGFYASAWLERKTGAWLQTSNGLSSVYCAKASREELEAMPWEEPLGFEADGKFFL